MAFVITDKCKGNKNVACLTVCPCDTIHPTPKEAGFDLAEQLYIDASNCIDCGLCAMECPVGAIFAEEDVPAESKASIKANADYYRDAK